MRDVSFARQINDCASIFEFSLLPLHVTRLASFMFIVNRPAMVPSSVTNFNVYAQELLCGQHFPFP